MNGFDRRTNLPDDLQAAIPHLVDAGGSRGPQHDFVAQCWLEAVWKASLGEAIQRGWVRLVPVEAVEPPPEPPPEPEPPGLLRGLLQRLLRREGGE